MKSPKIFVRTFVALSIIGALACGTEPVEPDPNMAFPTLLSDLALPTGQGYDPQFPLWTNGSVKIREAHVPAGKTVDNSAPDVWQFPEEMVLTKTFGYQTATGSVKKIETRVIRRRDLQWETAAYLWNDAGTSATLIEGDQRTPVSVTDIQGNTFDHVVPSYSDCQACHGLAPVFILGFNELQLNAPRVGGTGIQLENLAVTGTFSDPVPAAPAEIGGDPTTEAVIGYVQGNCAHCHHPAGIFDLTYDNFLGKTVNVPSPTGVTLIKPGDAPNSAIYARFASGSMPPVGVELRDETVRLLIENWIVNHNFATPGAH
jgi:mono/diheme cytochrome c family protein